MTHTEPRTVSSDLPSARDSAGALPDRAAAFFSALLTEQFVLQSARGTTVSESSSRAALYLTTLSGALVAYGFLADTAVAPAYLAIVLPIVFFVGAFTWERLVQTAFEDIIALQSIQRIRGYYATLLPDAEHYFPQPADRTAVNEVLDIGTRSTWRGVVLTTSSTVLTVNCIVGGAGVALGLRQAGLVEVAAIMFGVLSGLLLLVGFASYQIRQFKRVEARVVAPS